MVMVVMVMVMIMTISMTTSICHASRRPASLPRSVRIVCVSGGWGRGDSFCLVSLQSRRSPQAGQALEIRAPNPPNSRKNPTSCWQILSHTKPKTTKGKGKKVLAAVGAGVGLLSVTIGLAILKYKHKQTARKHHLDPNHLQFHTRRSQLAWPCDDCHCLRDIPSLLVELDPQLFFVLMQFLRIIRL